MQYRNTHKHYNKSYTSVCPYATSPRLKPLQYRKQSGGRKTVPVCERVALSKQWKVEEILFL